MNSFSSFSLDPRKLFSSLSSPSPATTEESVTPPPPEGLLKGTDGSEHTLKPTSSRGTLPRYSSTESDLDFVGSTSDVESPRTPLTPASIVTTGEAASSNSTLASRLSEEQLTALRNKEIITTQTPTDPNTLGTEYIGKRSIFSASLSPTTQAYALSQRTPKQIADAFYDVTNAQEFIPESEKVVIIPDSDPYKKDFSITYHVKQATENSILPTFEDEITLKMAREQLPEGTHVISFDQPEKSRNYFRRIKGSLTTERYEGKTLVCLETFVELRGKIIPRLVQNNDLKEATVELLTRILNLR